jgi:hypothetical protein
MRSGENLDQGQKSKSTSCNSDYRRNVLAPAMGGGMILLISIPARRGEKNQVKGILRTYSLPKFGYCLIVALPEI